MGFIIGSTLSEVIKYDLSAYKNESSVNFLQLFQQPNELFIIIIITLAWDLLYAIFLI